MIQEEMGALGPTKRESESVLGGVQALQGNYYAAEKTLEIALELKDDVFKGEMPASHETMVGLLAKWILAEVKRDKKDKNIINFY